MTCRCPDGRPRTVATFRHALLVSVVREHHGPCRMPDEELDRANWQPRESGPVLVHTQAPKAWWSDRAEARHQDKRPDGQSEPRSRMVRATPHGERYTPNRL